MQSQITTPTQQPVTRTWLQAYLAFLFSPKENLILKLAPLAILFGAPELVVDSFLPVIGEVSDLTALILTIIVVGKTLAAVHRYRQPDLTDRSRVR